MLNEWGPACFGIIIVYFSILFLISALVSIQNAKIKNFIQLFKSVNFLCSILQNISIIIKNHIPIINPTNKIESNRCSAFCMISNHTNTPNQPRSIPIYFPFLSTSRFVVVYDGISVLFFVSSLSLFCNALFCLVLLFHFTSFSFSSLSLSLEMVVNMFVSE